MSPDLNHPSGPPPPQPLPGRLIPPPVAPRKKRGCFGCLLGCLVVIILGVLLIGGCGYLGYHEIMKKTEGAVAEFKAQGFQEEKSDMITKDTLIQGKKFLNSRYIAIVSAGSDTDMAVVGFMAIIEGRVHGSLYYRGGILVIGPEAAIEGDVDVDCYEVLVRGYVQGQIKGRFQKLDDTQRRKMPPAALQPLPEEEKPALKPPGEAAQPPANGGDQIKPGETPQPPPAQTPAAPPPTTPAGPPATPTQPNPPDQQPPADSPAPPADAQPQPPVEPTPPNPTPVPPAPSPPAPAPPSQ